MGNKQIAVRLDDDILVDLAWLAAQDHRPIAEYVRVLIIQDIERKQRA